MRLGEGAKFFIFIFVLVSLLTGISGASTEFVETTRFDPPQGVRDRLTFDDLMGGNFPELVHNDYFMAIGSEAPAVHQLSGVIHFRETAMDTNHSTSTWAGGGMRLFPGFSVRVISYGEYLLPLNRGIIVSGDQQNSFWNIILSPGRVWQEAGDNGYSRASFPFTFTDRRGMVWPPLFIIPPEYPMWPSRSPRRHRPWMTMRSPILELWCLWNMFRAYLKMWTCIFSSSRESLRRGLR